MRSVVSFTCAAVRIAPVSAVSGSRPSAAAVTTDSARRPIHAPLPSSPHTGPQPPQRAVAPAGPRPNATEPVPLIRSTPGPSPKASSSAMLKSEWITSSVARSRLTSACQSSLALGLATGAGDADAKGARRHVRHLARRQRVAHDVRDHVRRVPRPDRVARRCPDRPSRRCRGPVRPLPWRASSIRRRRCQLR